DWSSDVCSSDLRQLIPRPPERGEEVVMDHLPEHFNRRPLSAHNLVADDPRDHLVVPDAPHRDALVPFDERFRELIELLVLAPSNVELHDVEPRAANCALERLAERRRHATDLAKPG